jgi:hypothetical protein
MGFDWDKSDLDSSSVLKASHLNDGIDAIQDFLNEGIGIKELKGSVDYTGGTLDPYTKEGWVDSKLIYRPEFYGSPSPRMMAVSGQTHFREVNNSWTNSVCFQADVSGAAITGVPNACTRIKLRHNATVNIMCSFYMFEIGGVNYDPAVSGGNGTGYENYSAGEVYLNIDGTTFPSTMRSIYTANVLPNTYLGFSDTDADATKRDIFKYIHQQQNGYLILPMIGRHQHNMVLQVDLDAGIHDVGIVFEPRSQANEPSVPLQDRMSSTSRGTTYTDGYSDETIIDRGIDDDYDIWFGVSHDLRPKIMRRKNVFFSARNLVVDCYYNDNEWYEETS